MKNKRRKKRQTSRRKMDCRRRLEYRKLMNSAVNSQKELNKRHVNTTIKYPGYPQRQDVLNFPLPTNVSYALKILESSIFGQNDEFVPVAEKEILTQTQYALMAGGMVNNFKELKMTEERWNNLKNLCNEVIAADKSKFSLNIMVALNYRIHLEALRLVTGKSLIDILYLGEINVNNEFDTTDNEFYKSIFNRLYEMVCSNLDLDLTSLTLKDVESFKPAS